MSCQRRTQSEVNRVYLPQFLRHRDEVNAVLLLGIGACFLVATLAIHLGEVWVGFGSRQPDCRVPTVSDLFLHVFQQLPTDPLPFPPLMDGEPTDFHAVRISLIKSDATDYITVSLCNIYRVLLNPVRYLPLRDRLGDVGYSEPSVFPKGTPVDSCEFLCNGRCRLLKM
jgi:hypothetical protein